MSMKKNLAFSMVALVALTVTGCFSGSGKDLNAVTGTITKDGVPFADAHIEFHPQSGEGAVSYGKSDQEGNFKLYYSTGQPGALPGTHKVIVQNGYKVGGKNPMADSEADPMKAAPAPSEQQKGEILVEVGKNDDNHIEIEL
ncbi:hypothetical protein AB1L30_21205 [Bremerella sp. JC817]|uniref:hypothetical protein n=1 Tax=Bremerella sp. JC817 TaxID=3231756 RepID=UPI00345AF2C3